MDSSHVDLEFKVNIISIRKSIKSNVHPEKIISFLQIKL